MAIQNGESRVPGYTFTNTDVFSATYLSKDITSARLKARKSLFSLLASSYANGYQIVGDRPGP